MLDSKNTLVAVSATSGALLTTAFAYYTYKQYRLYKKYQHIPGPGVNSLFEFYFGNLNEFADVMNGKCTFSEKMLKWAEEYGPVYKIHLTNKVMVGVGGPDNIKQVLIEDDYPKFKITYELISYPLNERFLGRGIITEVDKEAWREKRALLNNAFHRTNLEEYMREFNIQGDLLMEKLRSLADGKTQIQLLNLFNHATLDVIANVAFGLNINTLENSNNELNIQITKSLEAINSVLLDPFFTMRPNKYFEIKKYRKTIRDLRKFAKEKILNRINDPDNQPNDIMSLIFKTAKNDQLDLENLIDDFLSFFLAGQETTANALSFTILELGQNPECLRKLREEIDNVMGSRMDLTHEDLNKLEYTGAVFKETLRKWPPAPVFSRTNTEDTKLSGYFIPKDSWIAISTFASGRNPNTINEPEKFMPERFLRDSNNHVPGYTFIPFSLGPRNCIGQNFAQIEAKVFLAKFVQNFDIELDPNQSFEASELATMRPKDGCRCALKLRR